MTAFVYIIQMHAHTVFYLGVSPVACIFDLYLLNSILSQTPEMLPICIFLTTHLFLELR